MAFTSCTSQAYFLVSFWHFTQKRLSQKFKTRVNRMTQYCYLNTQTSEYVSITPNYLLVILNIVCYNDKCENVFVIDRVRCIDDTLIIIMKCHTRFDRILEYFLFVRKNRKSKPWTAKESNTTCWYFYFYFFKFCVFTQYHSSPVQYS